MREAGFELKSFAGGHAGFRIRHQASSRSVQKEATGGGGGGPSGFLVATKAFEAVEMGIPHSPRMKRSA
jgi:hypothetical protein